MRAETVAPDSQKQLAAAQANARWPLFILRKRRAAMRKLTVVLMAMAVAAMSLLSPPGARAAQPHITAGIVSSTEGYVFSWTPSKVFHWEGPFDDTATEVTAAAGGASISAVQGIVSSTEGYVFIWTPSKVYRWDGWFSDTAIEVKESGTTSIFSYDPTQVAIVQVAIHHVGSSGAGVVGKPASSLVGYTGSSTAAAIVPSSAVPSSHSTVLGAGPVSVPNASSVLILGPNPVPVVVSGNSMILVASSPSVGGIEELPELAESEAAASASVATNNGVLAGIAAAGAAGVATLGVALWYGRRRWVR